MCKLRLILFIIFYKLIKVNYIKNRNFYFTNTRTPYFQLYYTETAATVIIVYAWHATDRNSDRSVQNPMLQFSST